MRSAIAALVLSSAVFGAESLRSYEIRRPAGSATGKLVVQVEDRQLNLSSAAVRVWAGRHPDVLLYTEALPDGREQLRLFNAITGANNTVLTERLSIRDLTVARVDKGEYLLVVSARDASNMPSVLFAHSKKGVLRRIPNAVAGAIFNDSVELRFYDPADPDSKREDLSTVRPVRVSVEPLPN